MQNLKHFIETSWQPIVFFIVYFLFIYKKRQFKNKKKTESMQSISPVNVANPIVVDDQPVMVTGPVVSKDGAVTRNQSMSGAIWRK